MITEYRKKIIRNEVKRLIGRFKDEELVLMGVQLDHYLRGSKYDQIEYDEQSQLIRPKRRQ